MVLSGLDSLAMKRASRGDPLPEDGSFVLEHEAVPCSFWQPQQQMKVQRATLHFRHGDEQRPVRRQAPVLSKLKMIQTGVKPLQLQPCRFVRVIQIEGDGDEEIGPEAHQEIEETVLQLNAVEVVHVRMQVNCI